MSVRVLIVDDHELFRLGLRHGLERLDLTVVGEARDGVEALHLTRRLQPDAVVLDVRMPRMDGIEVCDRLATEHGLAVAIVILTTFDDARTVQEARRAGARAVLPKNSSSVLVAEVIGRAVGDPSYARFPHVDIPTLTPREIEVLRYLAEGHSAKRIGAAIGIGAETVRDNLQSIYRKLDVRDRVSAVRYAIECGLVRLPSSGG